LHHLRFKNSREILFVAEHKEDPQNRHHNTRLPTRMAQQAMKQQNVEKHRPQQRESKRNETARQHQCPADHLHCANKIDVFRFKKKLQEFSARSRRQHRRKKMQKCIRSEKHESKTHQNLRDDRRNLHLNPPEESHPGQTRKNSRVENLIMLSWESSEDFVGAALRRHLVTRFYSSFSFSWMRDMHSAKVAPCGSSLRCFTS